ncbi:MAG: methyltransferase domain-containing protein [bacterium]|nr:methyltransferase domain-containing protein [bacterium]
MNLFEEAMLEPVARYWRFTKGIEHMEKDRNITLVDLGCGQKMLFYDFYTKKRSNINSYIGIDPLLRVSSTKSHIKLIKNSLAKSIPLSGASVDYVVGFAFLEHIDSPGSIIGESIRVLKTGGKAIFTTPTWKAKGMLEFLSYKMGLISRREIEEHRTYFNKENLLSLVKWASARIETHHAYFELGYNNLFVITKKNE